MTLRVSSIFSFNILRVKFAHASQNPTTCECPSFYHCFGERELSGDSKWIFSLKIDSISPFAVMDHKWRENVIKNKKVAQEGRQVCHWCSQLPYFDAFHDPLVNRCTAWNMESILHCLRIVHCLFLEFAFQYQFSLRNHLDLFMLSRSTRIIWVDRRMVISWSSLSNFTTLNPERFPNSDCSICWPRSLSSPSDGSENVAK